MFAMTCTDSPPLWILCIPLPRFQQEKKPKWHKGPKRLRSAGSTQPANGGATVRKKGITANGDNKGGVEE